MIDLYEFIALAIEFEGCISIGKTINKYDTISYSVKVGVQNTSKELLEYFKEKAKFGTIIGPVIHENNKHKDSYNWRMNKKEIIEHLPKILPYLIIKQRQAELIIEIYNITYSKRKYYKLSNKSRHEMYTWEEQLTMELIYKECKELNKKGK